ncbi:unnamed protein product, partial [Phaeothamnion confervicola]
MGTVTVNLSGVGIKPGMVRIVRGDERGSVLLQRLVLV